MMKRLFAVLCNVYCLIGLALVVNRASADNPVVRHIYTADPAPLVYNGIFYVFTGRDVGRENGFLMTGYHLLSSTDMVNWTDHGMVVAAKDVTWLNPNQSWAGQCIYRDGKFYYYICDSGHIGVLVADNISGPYNDVLGKPLITNKTPGACLGDDNIDPSIFIDDDGKAYLYWGTGGMARQAKLDSTMMAIDGQITIPKGLTRFYEASWVHKRNGIYFYSYAAYNITGKVWPSTIDYATSTHPLGPWIYRGTLNDSAGIGTNHSGIAEYKGTWYLAYHTDNLSGGITWKRSVQIDCLYYDNDTTIRKVIQTTDGVEPAGDSPFLKEYYTIRSCSNGNLLAASGLSNVTQSMKDTDRHATDEWTIVETERGLYKIVNRESGSVLEADTTRDVVVQNLWSGNVNQKWKLTYAANGCYLVVTRAGTGVLELSDTNQNKIVLAEYNGDASQKWEIVRVGAGSADSRIFKGKITSGYESSQFTGKIVLSGRTKGISYPENSYNLNGRKCYPMKNNKGGDLFVICPPQH